MDEDEALIAWAARGDVDVSHRTPLRASVETFYRSSAVTEIRLPGRGER